MNELEAWIFALQNADASQWREGLFTFLAMFAFLTILGLIYTKLKRIKI